MIAERTRLAFLERLWKYKWTILVGVLALLGLATFASSFFFLAGPLQNVLSNLGVVLFTTGLVTLLFDYALKKDFLRIVHTAFNITTGVADLGISHISAKRSLIDLTSLFTAARFEIDILCLNSYLVLFNWGEPALHSFLAKGGRLRVLVIDPACAACALRTRDEHPADPSVYTNHRTLLLTLLRESCSDHRHSLQVRQYDSIPYCYLIIVDSGSAAYTPYLSCQSGKDLPLIVVGPTGRGDFLQLLKGHYEHYWEHASPVDIWDKE